MVQRKTCGDGGERTGTVGRGHVCFPGISLPLCLASAVSEGCKTFQHFTKAEDFVGREKKKSRVSEKAQGISGKWRSLEGAVMGDEAGVNSTEC